MPLMRRSGQQRIVPDRSVRAYQRRGWTLDDTPEAPSPSDVKAAWVDYAESLGIGLDSDMTKADIIAAVEAG